MSNMIDYLLSTPNFFEGRYIKGVESLIFSQLSYLHFEIFEQSLKLADITDEKVIDQLVERTWNEALNRKLITSLAKHPIWRHIQILDNQTQFDANSELQFSATTFKIAPDLYYIAFRGTNSTFVGWKEDFNLSYMNAIPSQTAAVAYVEHIISKYGGTHYLGGHSKGGQFGTLRHRFCL
ncbi:lipase [Streptococcus gallolyticus]|uniref:Lipase n=1 Tax=Streptococcus gallolyticus TaxID=315405 RepID=A0AA94M1B1_9STRE|nr:Mbeg1-like protein [Streptococcus gallolyticus]SQG78718.1 lipase [Streptococcus gallolyticus]